jgi:hypothetical protein
MKRINAVYSTTPECTIRIESQTHKCDAFGEFNEVFRASNGWTLKSVSHPELIYHNKTFFVQGHSPARNNRIITFPNRETFNAVMQAIDEYNKYFADEGVIIDDMALPSITTETYVYTKLTSLAPSMIFEKRPCVGEFKEYCQFAMSLADSIHWYDRDIALHQIAGELDKRVEWRDWLRAKRFINAEKVEVVKEEEEWYTRPIGVGDIFTFNDCETTLARTGPNSVIIVHTGKSAHMYAGATSSHIHIDIRDPKALTKEEFLRVFNSQPDHVRAIYDSIRRF